MPSDESSDAKRARLKEALADVRQLRTLFDSAIGELRSDEKSELGMEGQAALALVKEDLPEPTRNNIDELLKKCAEAGTDYGIISMRLHAIDVVLYGQLLLLGGPRGIDFPKPSIFNSVRSSQADADRPAEGLTGKMDEQSAAVLASATEKSYSSSAFSIAKWALVATVAFSLGGTVYVGDPGL